MQTPATDVIRFMSISSSGILSKPQTALEGHCDHGKIEISFRVVAVVEVSLVGAPEQVLVVRL